MALLWLLIFWLMQVVAQVLFKYGSIAPGRWLVGFIAGNVFGASSIWFMMLLYKSMNPNIALGLATGGAFLFQQLTLAVLFKSHLSFQQSIAIVLITAGMALFVVTQGKQPGG